MDPLLRDVESILSDSKILDILCIFISEPKLARLLKISGGHERFTRFIRDELLTTISLKRLEASPERFQLEAPPSEPNQMLAFEGAPPEPSQTVGLAQIIANKFPGSICALVDVKLGPLSDGSTDQSKEYHIVTIAIPHMTIVENVCEDRHIINVSSVLLRVHAKYTHELQPSESARIRISAGPRGCLIRICCCSTNHNVVHLNFDKTISPVALPGHSVQHYLFTAPGSGLSMSVRSITACKATIFLTGHGSVIW